MRWVELFFRYKTPLYQGRLVVASVAGACLTLLAIAYTSRILLPDDYPLVVASMGAALVILYWAPGNIMAQPWPVVAGHLVSAVVGVTCMKFIPDTVLAAGAAIMFAMLAMHYLRCLHPPGGAAALVPVIGGDQFTSLGYWYVLAPVALNVAILLVMAVFFIKYLSGRTYPVDYDAIGDSGNEQLKEYLQRDPFAKDYFSQKMLQCRDAMQPFEAILSEDMSTEALVNCLRQQNSGVVAVDKAGHLIGVATAASISLGVAAVGGEVRERREAVVRSFSDVQIERVAAVREDYLLSDVIPLIRQQNLHKVVIVDKQYRPLGWLKLS